MIITLPLKVRILAALAGRATMPYGALLLAAFPPSQYPRAYRRSSNGGPPGCAIAFGRALRELGGRWSQDDRVVRMAPP